MRALFLEARDKRLSSSHLMNRRASYLMNEFSKFYILSLAPCIGGDCVGASGLMPPLGNTTWGPSPPENCENEHFLVVQFTETQN